MPSPVSEVTAADREARQSVKGTDPVDNIVIYYKFLCN